MIIRSQQLSVVAKPSSDTELIRIAETKLRRAGVVGELPTPVEQLLAQNGIDEIADPEAAKDKFLMTLSDQARKGFLAAWQKVRGIADLRDRVVYVPRATMVPRALFAKSHEFGHQVIPWHDNLVYQDDDRTLKPNVEAIFEREANFFASEVIFQGPRFMRRALDYRPSLEAVFSLADLHGASRQATLWRFVEGHDEPLAVVSYLPSRFVVDSDNQPVLRNPRIVGSPAFIRRFGGIELPPETRTGHPWVDARALSQTCSGTIRLDCGAGLVGFTWEAWWNTYSLLVLLRRLPSLSFVGRIIYGETSTPSPIAGKALWTRSKVIK
jgi:IrrE N-terminal-like domain